MVTTLYLIRHGTTERDGEQNGVKRYKGSLDVPMSEKGIKEIEQTAQYIRECLNRSNSSNGLNTVYCSPLGRALKSAEIIAKSFGLTPIVVPELRERNFGVWEGMSFTEIKELYPAEFEAWANNPLKYSPMHGESTIEVRDRVVRALEKIISSHNGGNIAIAAHGGVNRIILCHIIGIPLENIFRIEQDTGCVNVIEFWDKHPVVKLLNGVPCG